MTSNRPGEDVGGWDYIVQGKTLDLPPGASALDQLAPSRPWICQVKATDSRRSPSVSLSNCLKLIEPAFPAFILLMHFGGTDEVIERDVFHVDKKFVARVMKRLRSLPLSSRNRVHKMKIGLSWEEGQALATLNGADLLRVVSVAMGPDAEKYWIDKKLWKKECGDPHVRITIGPGPTPEAEYEEQLVDSAMA